MFSARPRENVSLGRETSSGPEKSPFCAKAMKEGTSPITVASAFTIPVVKVDWTLPSSVSMLPSWIDFVSSVPEGHIALATPGACCNPVSRTVNPALAATDMPSPTAGIKAKPAVRAVKRSFRPRRVFCSGSIVLMRG